MAMALMGDFAVRVFASFDTFFKIAGPKEQPDIIVVNALVAGLMPNFFESLAFKFPDCLCVVVNSEKQEKPHRKANKNLHCWSWIDSFDLSSKLKRLLVTNGNKPALLSERLRYNDVVFDTQSFSIKILPDGHTEALPPKEARIMQLLLHSPGQTLSRERIKQVVWPDVSVSSRTIDSHVSRLRRRLSGAEVMIESVYGGGYYLK